MRQQRRNSKAAPLTIWLAGLVFALVPAASLTAQRPLYGGPDHIAGSFVEGQTTVEQDSDHTAVPTAAHSLSVDTLAHVLAVALSQRAIRNVLLEDMRDSPFKQHSLHLRSYFNGPRGRQVVAAGASRLGLDVSTLTESIRHMPDLQVWIPSPYQRATWTANDNNVVVFGTTASIQQLLQLDEYEVWSTHGVAGTISTRRPLETVLVVVAPTQWDFGPDPEHTRLGAAKQQRNTIGLMGVSAYCDPEAPPVEDCGEPGGGGGGGGGGGYDLGISWSACTNSSIVDNDYDELDDQCEQIIAAAFQPHLMFSFDDVYSSREPYWIVKQECFICSPRPQAVRIMYALAYHRDSGHIGDSEFIELKVSYSSGRWFLDQALLSAHWLEPWPFDATATYSYSALEWADAFRGAPRVYPSSGKHANYASSSQCNARVFEHCTFPNFWEQPAGVWADRNLGSFFYLNLGFGPVPWGYFHNCVGSQLGQPGQECFWEHYIPNSKFGGWLYGTSATPYQNILQYFAWRPPPQ